MMPTAHMNWSDLSRDQGRALLAIAFSLPHGPDSRTTFEAAIKQGFISEFSFRKAALELSGRGLVKTERDKNSQSYTLSLSREAKVLVRERLSASLAFWNVQ